MKAYGVYEDIKALSFRGKGLVEQFNVLALNCTLTPTKVYAEVNEEALETWVWVVSELGLPTKLRKTLRYDDVFGQVWSVEVHHRGLLLAE